LYRSLVVPNKTPGGIKPRLSDSVGASTTSIHWPSIRTIQRPIGRPPLSCPSTRIAGQEVIAPSMPQLPQVTHVIDGLKKSLNAVGAEKKRAAKVAAAKVTH